MSEGREQSASQSDVVTVHLNHASTNQAGTLLSPEEAHLVEKLRSGDEAAFVSLVDRLHPSMLRLAMIYVPARAVAEEVVQEAWIGVLQGLQRFEGRSSLKTWIFRILTNCAKTRAVREGRSVPFSSLANIETGGSEPAVDPERFLPLDDPPTPFQWKTVPDNWSNIPESRLLSQETRACIDMAIQDLPPGQRAVITLRDIEGWTAGETGSFLQISEVNQRVLLHRARSKVRQALERYFEEE